MLNRDEFHSYVNSFMSSSIEADDLPEYQPEHAAMRAMVDGKLPVSALGDQEVSKDNCVGAACAFARHVSGRGKPRIVSYRRPSDEYLHSVSEVNVDGKPHVVDFTYRQFANTNKFPLVENREMYDKRMKELKFEHFDDNEDF